MAFYKRCFFRFSILNICCLSSFVLEAKPSGFQLKQGEAIFREEAGGKWLVESGAKAKIDWESFSINLKEHVHFQQIDPKSYVLNCVKGFQESQILGQLTSNGTVYLINPNGIFIGEEARIQTAGFIASTLDLLDQDLSGLYFSGESEKGVVNWGKIECPVGDVFLIGQSVENWGVLQAPEGRQGLLAGCDVVICTGGAPQVHIRAQEMEPSLLEENPYAVAIRHMGESCAREIYLKTEGGICEASGKMRGAEGGKIHILAEEVRVLEGALLDVSGNMGGGEILIGGDYRGKNRDILNAKRTFVGKDVEMKADALEKGDGGKVIVWADDVTIYYGATSTQGGLEGGDGGLVEVSGKALEFAGTANTLAPQGKVGTLLLDPTDITIAGTSAATGGSFSSGVWTSTASTATIPATTNASSVQTLLGSTNVTINTSTNTGGPFGNQGTITVSTTPISWSAATTLTLIADSSLSISTTITNTSATTGFTAMNFTGGNTLVGNTSITPGIDVGAKLQTTGGNITLTGTGANVSGGSHGVRILTGSVVTSTGVITITGTVGGSSVSGSVCGIRMDTANGITSTSGSMTLSGNANGATGASCHGISVTSPWATGTSGTVNFTNCIGGAGGGNGLNFDPSASFSTSGRVVGTGLVGNGNGGIGFACQAFAASNTVNISASANGTSGACHGISIGGAISGGTMTLIGTAGASTDTPSHGVYVAANISASGISTVTGTAPGGMGTVASCGVYIGGTSTTIGSSSGSLTITGSSSAQGAGAHGGTLAASSLVSSSGSGGIIFLNCSGGPTGASHGLNIGATFTLTGSRLTFTTCTGGTGGGRGVSVTAPVSTTADITGTGILGQGPGGVGFFSSANVGISLASANINITASANGTSGACHGISITGATLNVSSSSTNIILSGTSGASTDTASYGINLATTNPITAITGSITCSGTSLSIVSGSHGVAIGAAWTTGTTGTVTFSNCIGGSTGASHGLNVGANFSTGGNLVATNTIRSNGGDASFGFNGAANFGTTGSASTVAITASSTGTSGACHGMSVTAGTISSVGGTITLVGTSGSTGSTPSYGIRLASADSSVSSATGTISITGTSQSTGAGSHGVVIETNPLNAATTRPLTIAGTAGSSSNASYAVNIAAALSNGGAINLNGGTGQFGNAIGANLTTSGGALTLASTNLLSASCSFDTTNGGGTAAGGNISLNGTINALAAYTQNLTLQAGTGGIAAFSAVVGGSSPLGTITAQSASAVNIGTTITAAGFTAASLSPVVITANSVIDTSGQTGGSILFSSTVNGATLGGASLTLTANGTGSVAFQQNVGEQVPLGALTISAGGGQFFIGTGVTSIQASSFTVGGTVPTVLQNTAEATITTVSSSGGSILFGGTIDGAHALTLTANGAGSVALSQNVGDSPALSSFTIGSGTAQLTIGTGMTGISANTFTVGGAVPTVLNNTMPLVVTSTGNIAFGGKIDGAHGLTLESSAGNITLSSEVGSSTPLGAIAIPNAVDVTASSSIAAASFVQEAGTGTTTFNGALTITGDIILEGNAFTFNAPVTAADDVTITNTGLLTIATAGDMTLSGAFSQEGATGLVQIAGNITTSDDFISFSSAVTLTGNVTLHAGGSGDINFDSTVNGEYSLTLQGDQIVFGSTVGDADTLTSLRVTGSDSILLGGDQTVSLGPMNYTGLVVLTTPTTLTDSGTNGIFFTLLTSGGSSIEGNYDLTLRATNASIGVEGDIDLSGTSGSAGGDLTVIANTGGTFQGQILTQGGNASPGTGGVGGEVSLSVASGSLSVCNINTSGGTGTVSGGSAGNITLSAAGGYTSGYPIGTIILDQDLSSGHDGNLVALSGSGVGSGSVTLSSHRSTFSTVATITSSAGGNDVLISAANFSMGLYEAMTVLGDLELHCNTVTLGDTIALGDLAILSLTTNLNTHGAIQLLASSGLFYESPSLHFYSGGSYINTGTLVPSSGPLSDGSVSLSSSTFRPLLFYSGHILNFDTDIPVPSGGAQFNPFSIYQLGIADAQLSDMLPIHRTGCNSKKSRCMP